MKLPFIILVDDDQQVLHALQRDIRNEYRAGYRIMATASAVEALDLIRELHRKNESVALIISDQRMPEMEGVDFLESAREIFPEAKLILLTAYSDIEAAIKAINTIKLDYYLLKPWNPPQEKLFPVINDLLDTWQAFNKPDIDAIRVIGFQWSPKSHQLKEFLAGNLVPFSWIDVDLHPDAEKYLLSAGATHADLPLVILKDGSFLLDPGLSELAGHIGLQQTARAPLYDVLIIGAGPAGLAASVYGSCEGLKTMLIEKSSPGGQAGNSARIENYLGFPNGLSGAELTHRAMAQTLRFGTEVISPKAVKDIRVQDGYKIVEMTDGTIIHARAIVIATGVEYAKLDVPGLDRFTGAGVYYGSASVEAHACRDGIVYIVGGGNSACQAALHISKFAKEVKIVIRRDSITQTAANYLVENINKTPNIQVLTATEVIAAGGDNVLENVTLKNAHTGEETTVPAKALFIYIGTRPGTTWLKDTLVKHDTGFIMTGNELMKSTNYNTIWPLKREPFLPETSIPGIFATGDVRYNALTGISSAVGEGAMAIRFVRKYLNET